MGQALVLKQGRKRIRMGPVNQPQGLIPCLLTPSILRRSVCFVVVDPFYPPMYVLMLTYIY